MVLTRSMASTTNNVQGDKPRLTAFERQVQTLTTTVERLTKQNQVLEEQLHQKRRTTLKKKTKKVLAPSGGTNKGPEGSNAPSRPKRQNISLPSLTDIAQPSIFVEMQAMKEQMEVMMNALKGRVPSDLENLVNQTNLPFTASINSFPLPHKFRMPQIDS